MRVGVCFLNQDLPVLPKNMGKLSRAAFDGDSLKLAKYLKLGKKDVQEMDSAGRSDLLLTPVQHHLYTIPPSHLIAPRHTTPRSALLNHAAPQKSLRTVHLSELVSAMRSRPVSIVLRTVLFSVHQSCSAAADGGLLFNGLHTTPGKLTHSPPTAPNTQLFLCRTALHYAAMAGHSDCVAQLLAYGATSVPDSAGRTPLMWALDQEVPQHAVAQALLTSDPTCNPNETDTDGRTCLHHIARRGDAESVLVLAHAKGVNFSVRDNSGLTALHTATLAGAVECVARLAAEGALNKKSRDMRGATALHLAVKTEDPALRLALVDVLSSMRGCELSEVDGTGCTALHTAAAAGDTAVMMSLMNHGCDRDAPDRAAEATPLMFAAKAGQLEAVKLLVR